MPTGSLCCLLAFALTIWGVAKRKAEIRANSISWDSAKEHSTGTRRSFVFDSGPSDCSLSFEDNGKIIVGEPPFRLSMSHAVIREGIAVFVGGGSSPHGFTIEPTGTMPSQSLVLGSVLGGSGRLSADGNDPLDWRVPGQMYLVSLSERQLSYDITANAQYGAVTVMLTPEAVELVASEDGMPSLVTDVLEGRCDPVAMARAMSPAAHRAARELVSPVYHGRMAHLYQEAKTLELLAHQMDMLTTELTPRAELTLRELNRVREARERLLADIQNPPDLAELARSVGMTPKRLNFGFRQLFGDTAFHYLLEVRMKTAKRMLDDGFEQPLKQVAWLVGYSQVSNFVTAFRRRFGVSPGIYRRSESDAE
jgi:AraC-like DNA-binding protein